VRALGPTGNFTTGNPPGAPNQRTGNPEPSGVTSQALITPPPAAPDKNRGHRQGPGPAHMYYLNLPAGTGAVNAATAGTAWPRIRRSGSCGQLPSGPHPPNPQAPRQLGQPPVLRPRLSAAARTPALCPGPSARPASPWPARSPPASSVLLATAPPALPDAGSYVDARVSRTDGQRQEYPQVSQLCPVFGTLQAGSGTAGAVREVGTKCRRSGAASRDGDARSGLTAGSAQRPRWRRCPP
jgi:hypothetical protein